MDTFGFGARLWADFDVLSRVRAKMWKGEPFVRETRVSRRAPPCLPVAPVMRILRSVDMVMEGDVNF
jgi:hypothetical protein